MVFSSYLFIFIFAVGTADILRVARQMEASVANDHELHILDEVNPSFVFLMFFTSTVDYTNGRLMTSYPCGKGCFTLLYCNQSDSAGDSQVFQFAVENYNAMAGMEPKPSLMGSSG